MSKRFLAAAAPLAPLALLAGCTVGPDYHAPKPALPSAFAEPQGTGAQADVDLAHWWRAFGDPELDRLIEAGLAHAPDLQTAASRVRAARLGVIQARAAGLPQINADAGANTIRFSKNAGFSQLAKAFGGGSNGGSGGGAPGQGVALPGDSITTYSAGFDASWELDLFGGVRRQVQSARAAAEAAEWDARDARVRLAAEIADDYLVLRGAQRQAAIAGEEADRQARSLSILAHTAEVGLVPQGNAIRQRTQLAAARARIAPLEAQAHVQMHALAVLVGEPPEALIGELSAARPLPSAPPAVPPGLPIDLIRRRPDVRAAERRLAAATADIGVAVADLYPKITLTGMAEFVSTALGNLFTGNSLQLSAAGNAIFPVLDFGRRHAAVGIRKEQREQAYLAWRTAVLGALRDVEDALARIDAERRSNAELRSGVADARRSLAAVEAQHKVGLADYTPVLDSQQQLLSAEDNLAQSDVRLRQDIASLYKALGGGWSTDDAPPAAVNRPG
ncbi:MAG TPA: efflux transporter outer membrane subunit [Sphingomonas sp.]|nr:efflux transporter outer membrane subunit [Sphingomonas sp.]